MSKAADESLRARVALLLPVAVAAWLLAIGAGFSVLTAYGLNPGAASAKSVRWPVETNGGAGDFTLIIAAHPKCPCTVATINELARLAPRLVDRVDIRIALYLPEEQPDAWARADVWRAAAQIPGAHVIFDRGGEVIEQLGAMTSGEAFLFNRDGAMVFHGGLTAARGHEGASVGVAAIEQWTSEGAGRPSAPVFGCTIRSEAD